MKAYSAQLAALLAAGQPIYKAHLYAVGPCLNGAMIYATDGSGPIVYGGNTYQPLKYGMWARDSITVKIGLDSNSTRLTVFADSRQPVYFPNTANAALLLDGIKYGLLGQAPVTVYCAYMPVYGQVTATAAPYGSYVETKFVGMVANVEYIGMTRAVIVIQDMLYLLNVQVPQMILQASCSNVLFNAKCTLSAASFSRTASIGTVLTTYSLNPTVNLTPVSAAGTFSQGTLTFTSGQNNGLSYFVRQWFPWIGAWSGSVNYAPGNLISSGGNVYACTFANIAQSPPNVAYWQQISGATIGSDILMLDVAPIFPLAIGAAFTVTEGCDKTYASCLNLQGSTNSLLNYSGQPTVPVPETCV